MAPQVCSLTVVLGLYKFLGGFPYGWSYSSGGTLKLRPSVASVAWTALVMLGMIGMSVTTLFLRYDADASSEIQRVLQHILNTYWYVLLVVLYVHNVVYSRSLARIFHRLCEMNVNMQRRLLGWDDIPMVLCILASVAGTLLSYIYNDPDDYKNVSWLVMLLTDRFADVTIVVLLLLMYVLVKILSLELEETVRSLKTPEALPCWSVPTSGLHHGWTPDTQGSAKDNRRLKMDSVVPENVSKAPKETPSVPENVPGTLSARDNGGSGASATSPALHLLALDGITQQLVDYMGLPVSLLLLNAISASTIFLYNLITIGITYYGAYLTVLLCRSVQIILIPDPLLRKVRKVTCREGESSS